MPVLDDLNTVLRPALPGDEAFLRALFECSREDDFALLPGSQESKSLLIDLQFRAQSAQYRANHPHSEHAVVTRDGASVGQVRTAQRSDAIDLLDISVLDTHRCRGIGTAVVLDLIERADAARLPVYLSVWALNSSARRFYAGLGFLDAATESGFLSMYRHGQAAPTTPEG
jgi:ribosomal protein S18 acetylase RimI-like enzyme